MSTWQIWNEQNSPTFYQPKVDVESYERLLQVASDAITERDPQAEVILGGMFGTPFKGEPPALSATDFLRQLYAIDGAREAFDAVAAHPYAAHEEKIELQVELLHDEIEAAGDDAGLWITEVGASSDEGANPLELGPEGQAEQLRTAFEYFLAQRKAMNIEGVTWYAWRDTSDPIQCDWCRGGRPVRGDVPGPEAGLGRVRRLHRRLVAAAGTRSAQPPAIAGRITTVSASATAVSRPSRTRTSSSLR